MKSTELVFSSVNADVWKKVGRIFDVYSYFCYLFQF